MRIPCGRCLDDGEYLRFSSSTMPPGLITSISTSLKLSACVLISPSPNVSTADGIKDYILVMGFLGVLAEITFGLLLDVVPNWPSYPLEPVFLLDL
ncbi:hypothetical protein Tco_1383492 [Tanacetum coccineum]